MCGGQTKLKDPDSGKSRRFAFDYSYWSHDGGTADDTGLLVKEEGHKNAGKYSGQVVFSRYGVVTEYFEA